jgi:hypothetical protein
MTVVLPKELVTDKVASLDGDMRKIAEELITKKFGVAEVVEKEEVKPKKARPFPKDEYRTYGDFGGVEPRVDTRTSQGEDGSRFGYVDGQAGDGPYVSPTSTTYDSGQRYGYQQARYESYSDIASRQVEIVVSLPAYHSIRPEEVEYAIMKLVREADGKNLRRDHRLIRIPQELLRKLMEGRGAQYLERSVYEGVEAKLLGCDVEIMHGWDTNRISLRARY